MAHRCRLPHGRCRYTLPLWNRMLSLDHLQCRTSLDHPMEAVAETKTRHHHSPSLKPTIHNALIPQSPTDLCDCLGKDSPLWLHPLPSHHQSCPPPCSETPIPCKSSSLCRLP